MKKTRSRTLLGVLGLLLAAVLVLCTMGLFAGCGGGEEPVEGGGDDGGDGGTVTYSLQLMAGGFGMSFFVGGTVTSNNVNVNAVGSDGSSINLKAGDGADDFIMYDANHQNVDDHTVTVTSTTFVLYVEYTGSKYDFGDNSKVASIDYSEYIHYGDAIVLVPASYGIGSGYGELVGEGDSASSVTAWLQYTDGEETDYNDRMTIDVHVVHYDTDSTSLLDKDSDTDYDTFSSGWNVIVASTAVQGSDGKPLTAELAIYIDTDGKVYTMYDSSNTESNVEYDITTAPNYSEDSSGGMDFGF